MTGKTGRSFRPIRGTAGDLAAWSDDLKKLDGFNLEFIEQPLGHDDLLDHAELAV